MTKTADAAAGYVLLILAMVFTAWGFHYELRFIDVQYSDVAFHLSILQSLDAAARGGQNVLDFWYDGVPYGFALFRSYQSLPHLVLYGLYRSSGEYLSLAQLLLGSTCLLAVILPASIFWSLRICGVRALECGLAAILSILVSDGSDYGMALQNFTFGTVGIVTQLWAMVFLPPAIATAFRFIHYGERLAGALLFGFLTFGCHVVAAAILAVCAAIFSLQKLLQDRRLSVRPFVLLGLMVVVTAHQWWFILSDSRYINRSALEPSWKYEGRGIEYLIRHFWDGGLFDTGRFPVITLLLLVSFCYTLIYRDRIRSTPGGKLLAAAPYLFLLFFSLCAGRDIWGWLFSLIPVLESLHVHRFAIGLHLFGIVTVAAGVAALFRSLSLDTARTLLILFLFLLLLRPALLERQAMYVETYARHSESARLTALDRDLPNLLDAAMALPSGWIYIGSKSSWQSDLRVAGFIPLDIFMAMRGVPAVGGILYHAFSLAGETLFDFNPGNSAHFDLFGIRSIVAPVTWPGASRFSPIGTFGRFGIWSRESRMLFVGDERFVARDDYSGQTELARSFVQGFTEIKNSGGSVVQQRMDHPWQFEGTAEMTRDGTVIAAVGYHPNWEATVDGGSVATRWVLPGFVQIEVPEGSHRVAFRYVGSEGKKYLLLLAIGTIIFTSRVSRRQSGPVGERTVVRD